MIYGLLAAVGWGLADYSGAIAGRRIGSVPAVVLGQVLSAAFMTALVVATSGDVGTVAPWLELVAANGIVTATAYATHYRALQLGPVAVVSPIGGTYALPAIVLAVVVLGERPSGLALVGAVVTVTGVVLTSTNLRALRAGLRGHAPGLWWAIVSALGFGVAAFLLGVAARELGWVVGLWASRSAQVLAYVPLVLVRRREFVALRGRPEVGAGIAVALAAGAADVLGVTTYSIGSELGFISIVVAASAIFPAIAVGLSIVFLRERLVPNQWLGVALVLSGLVLLGLGSR
ncbi:MAG: membrane protein [Actinomycetota bacterium]|nr:MAG: membrane protein [Actinomycetota bacterium]